jgi:uncharacterized membrane protein YgcG
MIRKVFTVAGISLVAALGLALPAQAAINVPAAPPVEKPVVDTAQVLDSDKVIETITDVRTNHGGHEIAVLTVPSLDNETIEDYSLAVANEWGVGDAEANDGILIFIAAEDRESRIEVGSGLESTVTDDIASQIMQNKMIPEFRNGDYTGGVISGVETLGEVFDGNYEAAAPSQTFAVVDNIVWGVAYVVAAGGVIAGIVWAIKSFRKRKATKAAKVAYENMTEKEKKALDSANTKAEREAAFNSSLARQRSVGTFNSRYPDSFLTQSMLIYYWPTLYGATASSLYSGTSSSSSSSSSSYSSFGGGGFSGGGSSGSW